MEIPKERERQTLSDIINYEPDMYLSTADMDLIRSNMVLNETSELVEAAALDWTKASTFPPAQSFDVVIAMECVYKETLYLPLLNAMGHCLAKDGLVFLGLTRQFAQPHFFAKLASKGMSYILIPHDALPKSCLSNTGGEDCGIFLVRRVAR